MEVFQLAERFGCLDYFLATTHRFHQIIGEYEGVKLAVDTVRVGPFDKQDRFPAAKYFHIYFFWKTFITLDQLVIPYGMICVVRTNPDPFAVGAGGGEINVMCEINKRTVRAYRLNLVPKLVLLWSCGEGFPALRSRARRSGMRIMRPQSSRTPVSRYRSCVRRYRNLNHAPWIQAR